MPDSPLSNLELRGRDGLTLRADAVGPEVGRPVLLLHGGGQTRHSWHHTAHALASRGWRAITIDLRGHGDSGWPEDGDYTIDAYAHDLVSVCSGLTQRPILVGASLGGIASLVAIGETPTPLARALVLVDVAAHVEPAGILRIHEFMAANAQDGFGSLEEVAEAIARYNPHRPRPKDLSGLTKNLRQRADGRWVWHWDPRFMTHMDSKQHITYERLARDARAITVPTLLVRGRQSDLLSREGADDFMRLVPHAKFADVAGAGHMIAGDRNDAFNAAVVEFIDTEAR